MNKLEKMLSFWLHQRQEILIILNNLARLLPNSYETPVSLTKFFQLLIDYACAWHLQIFNQCVENTTEGFIPVKQILKQINNSTDFIVKFNYKYEQFKNISAKDIVVLLENFADRIELEDLLLNMKQVKKHQIN